MVELLRNFPPHVAAYLARGKVDKAEYENTVMGRVQEVEERFGAINFLVKAETDATDYSPGAMLEYLKMTIIHFKKWNRMAVVTDEKWLRQVYDVLGPLLHHKVKTYLLQDYAAAKQWISEPLAIG